MIIRRKGVATVATFGIAALVLAGCSSSDSGDGADDSAGGGGESTGIITTNGSEPEKPLYPADTAETGGGKITTLVYSNLVQYETDGAVILEDAESIEPNEDSTVWTVTLREGLTFSNGDPVTAESYINAWNYGANLDNLQGASFFFDNIEGYSAEEASDLSGLEQVDDLTFTVSLINPEADFITQLGYQAFSPLPDAAYDDTEAFGQSPIGSGPYKLASEDAWENEVGIELVTNESYSGPREATNGGVSITFYTSSDTAYADAQSGNLDVLDNIPAGVLGTFEDEFPDRSVNQPAAIYQGFSIPYYVEHFEDSEEGELRRQAISKAIDRQAIIDSIFEGARTAAVDFSSPTIEGWSDSLAGVENVEYDPEGAKELWDQADEIAEYDDTFTISYNADADHEPWVTATTNSIASALDIQAEGKPVPTFSEFLDQQTSDSATGGYRSGWQGTYPSLAYFLESLYRTGGEANDTGYSSDEVDTLLAEAAEQPSPEDAITKYQEAQEVLLQDLPSIPLWYGNAVGVWSEAVDNVEFSWNSVPVFEKITKE